VGGLGGLGGLGGPAAAMYSYFVNLRDLNSLFSTAGASHIFEGSLRIIGGKFGNFLQEYNDNNSLEYRSFESAFLRTVSIIKYGPNVRET